MARKSSTRVFPSKTSSRIAIFALLNFLGLALTVIILKSVILFPLPVFIVACFSSVANLCCYGTSGKTWNFFLENLKGDGVVNIVRVLPLIAAVISMTCAIITANTLFSVAFPPLFLAIPLFVIAAYATLGMIIFLGRVIAIEHNKPMPNVSSSVDATSAQSYQYQSIPSPTTGAVSTAETTTAEKIARSGGSPLISPLAGSPDMQSRMALEATPLKPSDPHRNYNSTAT